MENNNELIFSAFAEKAKKRIEERKKLNTKQFYVQDADVTLTLRGITEEEFSDISEMFESEIETDKYTLYTGCRELQEAAKCMMEQRELTESTRYKITEMFQLSDRTALVREILKLSGFTAESSVTPIRETDEVKN